LLLLSHSPSHSHSHWWLNKVLALFRSLSLADALSLSLSLSLSLARTFEHACVFAHTLSHTHSLARARTFSLTHIYGLSLAVRRLVSSLPLSGSQQFQTISFHKVLALSLSLSLSLSRSLSLSHSLGRSFEHGHSRVLSCALTFSLSLSRLLMCAHTLHERARESTRVRDSLSHTHLRSLALSRSALSARRSVALVPSLPIYRFLALNNFKQFNFNNCTI
jgi:hypothetical protein